MAKRIEAFLTPLSFGEGLGVRFSRFQNASNADSGTILFIFITLITRITVQTKEFIKFVKFVKFIKFIKWKKLREYDVVMTSEVEENFGRLCTNCAVIVKGELPFAPTNLGISRCPTL